MIVMTGDMADNSSQAIGRLTDLCRRLCRRYPIYYVVGNHEQCLKGNGQKELLKNLKGMGVMVLDNSWRTISRGGASIKIYGLATPMIYYKDRLREYKRMWNGFWVRQIFPASRFCWLIIPYIILLIGTGAQI